MTYKNKMFHGLTRFTHRVSAGLCPLSSASSSLRLTVEHNRDQRRFTVSPGNGAVDGECAVLIYRFTGAKEVDLMSTFVPEKFRGQGVAALLTQAAMDFLQEENLKARVSCWYINKFIKEQPLENFKDLIIS